MTPLIDVFLREREIVPVSAVPILALVLPVLAADVASVLEFKPVNRQLGLVKFPSTVTRVGVGESTKKALVTLIHSAFNHHIGDERFHFEIHTIAATFRVQHIHPEENVEWSELEGVQIERQRDLPEAEMDREGIVTQEVEHELRIG